MDNVLCETTSDGRFRVNTEGYKAVRSYIKRRYPRAAVHAPMLDKLADMWPEAHKATVGKWK